MELQLGPESKTDALDRQSTTFEHESHPHPLSQHQKPGRYRYQFATNSFSHRQLCVACFRVSSNKWVIQPWLKIFRHPQKQLLWYTTKLQTWTPTQACIIILLIRNPDNYVEASQRAFNVCVKLVSIVNSPSTEKWNKKCLRLCLSNLQKRNPKLWLFDILLKLILFQSLVPQLCFFLFLLGWWY